MNSGLIGLIVINAVGLAAMVVWQWLGDIWDPPEL